MSVARRVKLKVPAVVGVPEIVPELLTVSPGGRAPAMGVGLTDHVPPPPDTTTDDPYGMPTCPVPKVRVGMERGGQLTVRLNEPLSGVPTHEPPPILAVTVFTPGVAYVWVAV